MKNKISDKDLAKIFKKIDPLFLKGNARAYKGAVMAEFIKLFWTKNPYFKPHKFGVACGIYTE